MGRKLAFLFLLLSFGAAVETTWSVKHNLGIGPEGCRVIGGQFYGTYFTFDEETTRALAEGAPVTVENAFGAVKVGAGAPGEVRVRLSKRVYRPTREEAEAFARRIELVFEETGGGLRLTTNRDALSRQEPHVGFETSLEVSLPPQTRVVLKNEHGPVEVKDVAAAKVDSSFDTLVLERVAGPAEVNHRHGDVEVVEVGGTLDLVARHGNVAVRGVAGATSIDAQHGDVTIEGSAAARVKLAHGDLEAKTVGGDLDVEAEHAKVRALNVTGAVRIATSFEELEVQGVGGDATLRVEHGHATAREVKGGVTVEARFDGVKLETIGGPAEVKVEHGGLEARDLAKGLKVVSEGDDVRLTAVRGPVEVRTQRGEVRLAPDAPITEPVTIETTHGAIRLEVPPGSRFELDASARHADLVVDLPGAPEVSRGTPNTLRATFGGGGSRVSLRSENGEITVTGGATTASN
jgi:DUF4097 and DUF4098 domain-containing protein YvlB